MYNKLVSLLEEKEKLLDRFLTLTSLQQEYILNDNFDEISKVVDEKGDLIERINRIDSEFLEEFESIKRQKGIKSFDEITDIDKETGILLKNLTSSILQKLQVIKDIDEKNNILIRAKFDEIKKTLKSMRYKKEALKDYSSTNKPSFHPALTGKNRGLKSPFFVGLLPKLIFYLFKKPSRLLYLRASFIQNKWV